MNLNTNTTINTTTTTASAPASAPKVISHTTSQRSPKSASAARIWLDNADKLASAGFVANTRFAPIFEEHRILLIASVQGKVKVSASGKGLRPIIDICNARVASVFPVGTALLVKYEANHIIIEEVK